MDMPRLYLRPPEVEFGMEISNALDFLDDASFKKLEGLLKPKVILALVRDRDTMAAAARKAEEKDEGPVPEEHHCLLRGVDEETKAQVRELIAPALSLHGKYNELCKGMTELSLYGMEELSQSYLVDLCNNEKREPVVRGLVMSHLLAGELGKDAMTWNGALDEKAAGILSKKGINTKDAASFIREYRKTLRRLSVFRKELRPLKTEAAWAVSKHRYSQGKQ